MEFELGLEGSQEGQYLERKRESIPGAGDNLKECPAKIGPLMHYWWSCELVQPFWKASWNYGYKTEQTQ